MAKAKKAAATKPAATEGEGGEQAAASGPVEYASTIEVPEIKQAVLSVTVKGDSLITRAWSEKSREQMRDAQTQKVKAGKRPPKDPDEEFENSRYLDQDGDDCVPAIAFKNAMVAAARFIDGVAMTTLRGALFVRGEKLKIRCERMDKREDSVNVGKFPSKVADLRYRPEYINWEIDLEIEYDEEILKPAAVLNLLRRAGFSVGICEWRPEKNGQHGRFTIAEKVDVKKKAA
jgi:hypothetical protein